MASAPEPASLPVQSDATEKTKLDIQSVLAFLRDRGLHDTENLLQRELQNVSSSTDQSRAGDY